MVLDSLDLTPDQLLSTMHIYFHLQSYADNLPDEIKNISHDHISYDYITSFWECLQRIHMVFLYYIFVTILYDYCQITYLLLPNNCCTCFYELDIFKI